MTHPVTLQARENKLDIAASMAVDEAFISDLIEEFYARIRVHPVLGPIFARHVRSWEPHLARMKDFWTSVAIESGRFKGNPMLKHIAIHGLGETHFTLWLELFRETLNDIAPTPRAVNFFEEKSRMIGQSLLAGIDAHKMRKQSPTGQGATHV